MTILAAARRFSIASGLYRPARWLTRRLQPDQMRQLHEDTEFFRSLIAPGSLTFDVGANVGEKSEALLRAGARVVAFEPNPMVLPELVARCGHDKQWTHLAAAVGAHPAIATLHARGGHVNSSLVGGGKDVVATFSVPVLTLDAAIEHFGIPAFCKIDVEGWELEVLNGLTQPIPLIAVEFRLGEVGTRKSIECLKRLAEFGPSLVNITPAETPRFHFREWMPLTELLAWFPGDLRETLPGDHYGDFFVRRDAR